jgi:glycosyltransferase involved in cell wall biosynthesis
MDRFHTDGETKKRFRLAIVTTHPIQYYAPWFRWMVANASFELRVFYLWNSGSTTQRDPGFGHDVEWDVPLLDGYDYEFLQNTSARPGTHRFLGLQNPEMLKRLKSWRPDAALLIGYRYASMLRLVFTPRRWRGFPLLFRGDSHRLSNPGQSEKWRGEIRKRVIAAIYQRFATFLYVGQANREYFLLHGVPEKRLFFAPHAVDNARFMGAGEAAEMEAVEWRRQLGISADHRLILFAGKFQEKKRPVDLLEAFARLARPDVSLLFVGAGELEKKLRKRAAHTRHVYFAPFQNQSRMPTTYAACDLFVLPSFGPEESWGLAVNEALCLGRPVVVSSHVGCAADLVYEGKNGWIFPAGDIESLTRILETAFSDADRLVRFGKVGLQIVQGYNYANATRGLEWAISALVS